MAHTPGTNLPRTLILVVVCAVGLLSACGADAEPTPTIAPTIRPSPAPLRVTTPMSGRERAPTSSEPPEATVTAAPPPAAAATEWVRHAAHKFELDVPGDWIALEVRPESIDALIEELQTSNPGMVPNIAALKRQQGPLKFYAFRPGADPQFQVNLSVVHGARGIPIDGLVELLKEQLGSMGMSLIADERSMLSGHDSLRLHLSGMMPGPAGAPVMVEIQQVIVDYGHDRYFITITTRNREMEGYKEVFDSLVRSFSAVEGSPDPNTLPGQAVPQPAGYKSPTPTSAGTPHLSAVDDGHPDYTSKPATSGFHVGQTTAWGVHEQVIPDEVLLHNLEHAGVGVHYSCPEACPELVARLVEILTPPGRDWVEEWVQEVRATGDRAMLAHAEDVRDRFKVVLSPYPGMDTRIALTAWGFIDQLDEFDRSRILDFLRAHINSHNAPEPFAR